MSREHPSLSSLAQSLCIGSLYQHYKGAKYKVLAIAFHEETHEELVIYTRENSVVWARPLSLFLEHVSVDGMPQPRFKLVQVSTTPEEMKALPLVERAENVLQMYRKALLKKSRAASVNAYLILRKEEQLLFSLRQNTGYCDGMWGLVAGHVEEGESATHALLREAREEIGLTLNASQIKPVHVMHRRSDRNNIDIFFDCSSWEGSIVNCEKDKCAELAFFPLEALPSPLIGPIAEALARIGKGETYSEYGWCTEIT